MEDIVKLLIGIMVIAVVGVAIIVPVLNTTISATTTHGTVSAEAWAGTAATGHALAYIPVTQGTQTLYMLRNTTVTNTTPQYTGLGVAPNKNNASLFLTQTPITTLNANISILYNATVDNQSVSINGHKLGNLTTLGYAQVAYFNNISSTWLSTPSTYVEFTTDLNFNVTSITFNYSWWNGYTSYTIDPNNGIVTTSHSGRFKADYSYGAASAGLIGSILFVLPILTAAIILVFIGKELTDLV